jgi:hypothetical protein
MSRITSPARRMIAIAVSNHHCNHRRPTAARENLNAEV